MADWIKMRSSLLTNPKVIRMARVLLANREFLDWLCPGCELPVTRDETVTKRHVPVVTRVVVGALLPTWSAVNDTAGRDGVIRYAASRDIDETAGVPGFGAALMAVDWLEEFPDGKGLRFVNFEEHNSPQKERTLTAMTGAERAKAYRERKAAERDGERDASRESNENRHVTSNDKVTSRVTSEESREEKKKNPSGSTPPDKPARKAKALKRVPVEFVVTADMEEWAGKHVPAVDWRRETEKFRDWEFQHARTDWPATWRTWMRKAQESAEARGGGAARQGQGEVFV